MGLFKKELKSKMTSIRLSNSQLKKIKSWKLSPTKIIDDKIKEEEFLRRSKQKRIKFKIGDFK